MTTNVIMPQLGESVVEGTVSRWLKAVGDRIEAFDPLLEISTDKVETEIPSPGSGILLAIHVAEGQTVAKGTLLAVIGQPNEAPSVPAQTTAAQPPGIRPEVAPLADSNGQTWHVTPVVARMAAEHHIDLKHLTGSGHGGRVTKKDVEAFLARSEAAQHSASQPASVPAEELAPWERPGSGDLFKPTVEYDAGDSSRSSGEHTQQTIQNSEPFPVKPTSLRLHPAEPIPQWMDGELVPHTQMRKLIAEHMVKSKLHTSPHVTTVFEVDLSAVLAHREARKAAYASQGVNLTLTAYFVAATVAGLRLLPYLNAEWRDEGIYLHRKMHIGLAVALDEGLIVPVLKNAQDLNLLGIARGVNDLASRARAKQLKADETRGGTFTITNHGVSGSLFATPIINQPQVAILGVGVMEQRVKVIDGMIAIRPCAYVSLTFDHRVADGAIGDGFMLAMKNTLEKWAD